MSVRNPEEPARPHAWRRGACEAFVEAHYRDLYRFFYWLTRDRDAAADLTQETFAAFWESVTGPEPRQVPDLKAWLYGIARNRWRKRCRDGRAEPADGWADEAAEVAESAPGPEARVIAAMERDRIARAIAGLPPDFREALVMRVFQELSYGQIAAALGIREGLARWRVHRARAFLRAALLEEDGGEVGKEGTGARAGWRSGNGVGGVRRGTAEPRRSGAAPRPARALPARRREPGAGAGGGRRAEHPAPGAAPSRALGLRGAARGRRPGGAGPRA